VARVTTAPFFSTLPPSTCLLPCRDGPQWCSIWCCHPSPRPIKAFVSQRSLPALPTVCRCLAAMQGVPGVVQRLLLLPLPPPPARSKLLFLNARSLPYPLSCCHAGRAPSGAASGAATPMETSRTGSFNRMNSTSRQAPASAAGMGDSGDPAMPDADAGAAAGTGKRAKKKAVRSSQKAPAAADPVRDEAAAKVGGFHTSVELRWA
jgi:hypothetical protein